MDARIWTLDSITHVDHKHQDQIVIAGSHGGQYCGWYAAQAGVRGVILHDAGVGLEQAGISCLTFLDRVGIAAATVDYRTARIGDGADLLARGKISFCNAISEALGITPGIPATLAAHRLLRAEGAARGKVEPQREARSQLSADNGHGIIVIGMDSNSLVRSADARCIVVTGSHGALLGGRAESAIGVAVQAAVYNDAGGGIDEAGYSRLPVLDARGIPAMTVYHTSARIGDARSSWATGIVSRTNDCAKALGIRNGMTVPEAVARVQKPIPIS
ncbi:hypothetical protein KVP09_04240 [Alcaligenaceae bacterium CGII-47]|nr:hypothetical protein [Alcaligenaceae bacterium CGII-47]